MVNRLIFLRKMCGLWHCDIDFMFKRLKRCILQSELFDQIDFMVLHVKNIAAPVRPSLRGGSKLCVSELCS